MADEDGASPDPRDPDADSSKAEVDSATADGPRREVVVPLSLYKTVTVFSTLFAVVLVVLGMVALDVATGRGTASAEEVDLLVAAAGVCSIVGGAAVYAFAARFRAAGMGNPKDDDGENSGDGRRVR